MSSRRLAGRAVGSFTGSREQISESEMASVRKAAAVASGIRARLASMVRAGADTKFFDDEAVRLISEAGAKPAFLGYRGYPASVCVSINEEVVHGIPAKDRRLKEGDIVSFDLGVIVDGFYGDVAGTYPVGKISPAARRLMDTTRQALEAGVEACRLAKRVGDISAAIQKFVEDRGFGVIRDLVGHGVGRSLHEPPQVPNFGTAGIGPRLSSGMVIALEPMVVAGDYAVSTLADGWTVVTRDRSLAAHFEDMVAWTRSGVERLTDIGLE